MIRDNKYCSLISNKHVWNRLKRVLTLSDLPLDNGWLRSSLHESGLSFNPERPLNFNSCLHGRLSWGLKDHGEWKSHSGLKLVSDLCTDNLIFPAILALIYTLKYVNKTSNFPNNFYFGHSERRFYSEFHSRVKFRSKFTWFRMDISFRIECWIRKEKWNEFGPEWVATQSGFM